MQGKVEEITDLFSSARHHTMDRRSHQRLGYPTAHHHNPAIKNQPSQF
jgi:hypothetical protein